MEAKLAGAQNAPDAARARETPCQGDSHDTSPTYILPPFLFSVHIRFGQSQTLETLTKFVGKNINIYNNKSRALDSLSNVLPHHIDLLL